MHTFGGLTKIIESRMRDSPIVMEDFVLAKQTLRVSTAMDTPARESMMKWHGRFGEGGKNTTPSNIGF